MQYRNLGNTGLQVSELSFGAWITFGDSDAYDSNKECMRIAYDAGVNFFDNAEAYANGEAEVVMGRILRDLGWRRDSYCVSSKVFFGIDERKPTQKGTSRKHLRDACDGALTRFGLDYLDLFFCHRYDELTPVEEVVRTMNDFISEGKILYWGTSEWPADRINEAFEVADNLGLEGPSTEQPQYNLISRKRFESEYAPVFENHRIGSTIWSPLASGLLSGKYNDGVPAGSRFDREEWLREIHLAGNWEEKCAALRRLAELAENHEFTLPQLAIAWCLQNSNVSTVILGASRPEQVSANLTVCDLLDAYTPQLHEAVTAISNSISDRSA